MDKKWFQNDFDVKKWLESEQRHFDMCGTYNYCLFCDKIGFTPCADAYGKMGEEPGGERYETQKRGTEDICEVKAAERKFVVGETPDKGSKFVECAADVVTNANCEIRAVEKALGKNFDYDKVMAKKADRKSLSFAEKYALSDDLIKEKYAIIKSALLETSEGTPKIKSRISNHCDTFRKGRDIVAKITIIGASLRINLPLDPYAEEYCDGKTPHVSTGHKKVYESVPFQFKINSKLALRRALKLIEQVK